MAEDDVSSGRPVGAAAPVAKPRSWWVVPFALFGAALTAYHWANACPARPLDTFLVDVARSTGMLLFIFILPAAMVGKNLFQELRDFVLVWAPLCLGAMVPAAVSMMVGWEGGSILGIAGTAAGAAAGAVMGWMFLRWTLPDLLNPPREPVRANRMPIVFAVFFALFGAFNWGVEWLTLDHVWILGLCWLLLALPAALAARPLQGLSAMSPIVVVTLVPLVASMTVGWEGGVALGIAGAAAGAAMGAAMGWMHMRWIMPDYEKRRALANAVRPPGSTDGRGSRASMVEQCPAGD